jgi:RND family efflux transporter MFP subunit
MKKRIGIALVFMVVVIAIVWRLGSNKAEIESRKEVKADSSAIAVVVAPVSMHTINNSLELVGTAEANREISIASETVGKITQIYFKKGDFVSEGEVLAQVDDTYKRLALENARLNHDKYKEDYERYQVLQQGDAVTETQLRDIRLAYEGAIIQLEQVEKQWKDTRILAPFGGYITSRNIELGTFVNQGTPIAEIVDIETLKVVLSVSETNAYKLKTGQKVNVTTVIYPGIVFVGTVSHISPKGDKEHSYPIEISITNNRQYPLKAGTYVAGRIDLDDMEPWLAIPRDAIVSSIKDPSVYKIENNSARLVKINTGRDDNAFIEVLSGLKEGDKVVVSGQINLTENAKVSVIKN